MGLHTSSSTRLGRSGHEPGPRCLHGNAWIKWLLITSVSSLPTSQLLQGWFEAHVAHRISPRPHTWGQPLPQPPRHSPRALHAVLCQHQSGSSHLPPRALPPQLGARLPRSHAGGKEGRRGRQGKGVPVPKLTPGTKQVGPCQPWAGTAWRLELSEEPAYTTAWQRSVRSSIAARFRSGREGTGARRDSRGQEPHRVLRHTWRACFWGRRGAEPPMFRASPRTAQALGDVQQPHGSLTVPPGTASPSSAPPGALRRGRAQRHHWVAPERRGRHGGRGSRFRSGPISHSPAAPLETSPEETS